MYGLTAKGEGTGKNDHAQRAAHRAAVSGTVIHSISDAWHSELL